MSSVYKIEAGKYNELLAEALKKIPEFKEPEWMAYVKTSVARERPPKEEFWFKRAASILRQLYINEVVGVGRLKTRYGGRKNRGGKPEEFRKGSGKIIRVILQQAEKAGLVEKYNGKKKGRKLTEEGRKFLEDIKAEKEKKNTETKEKKIESKSEGVEHGREENQE